MKRSLARRRYREGGGTARDRRLVLRLRRYQRSVLKSHPNIIQQQIDVRGGGRNVLKGQFGGGPIGNEGYRLGGIPSAIARCKNGEILSRQGVVAAVSYAHPAALLILVH